MRTKKFLSLFILISLFTIGCQRYDDTDIWTEIGQIKTELTRIKSDLSNLQKVVEAQQKKKTVDDVKNIEGGYEIIFSDGTKATIKNGLDAPNIGIQEFEGVYYWTLGGKDKWITDKSGNKIAVVGQDGHSPVVSVDEEGFWTLDGKRVKDTKGNEVKAVGKDGDSFFQSVRNESDAVTFVLTNGEEIRIPKTTADIFAFKQPEGDFHYYVFKFGATQEIALTAADITTIEVIKAPEGWNITVNKQKKTVSVKAPAKQPGKSYMGGIITLMGLDKKGGTHLASIEVVASVDFTDVNGTFVVCEGNMSSANGTIVYYDKNNTEYLNIFENANNGLEIGNVVQDMYMANGRVYIITQNGSRMMGAGRFVVCDARTMRMEYADALEFKTPDGKGTWPQHLVICNDSLGYVQWAESGMEATSGIVPIIYKNGKVKVGDTLRGTSGAFTKKGATKTRLVFSRDKVYAACGHGMVIIDPKTNSVIKHIDYNGRQAKGIVKGANGNIFVAFAGTFEGSQQWNTTYTSSPIIVEFDHKGNKVHEHTLPNTVVFPVATWTPAIGMCASFIKPYLYFADTDAFNNSSASRYNYETKQLEYHYIPEHEATLYGIMGEHPKTGQLWVGRTANYVESKVYLYDTTTSPATEINNPFHYPTQKGASTAGIDFAYRFTPEFIKK